ncbi:MAG: tRNA pseudouridine(38-40) synthase TruA [Burkholderiales bacterium]|jgi:tRNA pseudouridine38-40 synthase|nr:tRNA pseudouridine(38-40) synthase TruA [Burkholderiales bacterium]
MDIDITPPGRFAFLLEYFGAPFCGWQTQTRRQQDAPHSSANEPKNGVQYVVERAISAIAQCPMRVVVAGRTDAGAHASAQVCHADIPVARPLTAWVRGVNAHLPASVSILWAQPVNNEFHARFSATARHYTYWLENRPQRSGLWATRVGWYSHNLDERKMHVAAQSLLGTHDFSSFRSAECQAKSPVKTMKAFTITRYGDFLCFNCTGNAFLHHMVRNIIGALIWIGNDKKPVGWLEELLACRDRTRAAPTFSAEGLYFSGIDYDDAFNLPPTRRMPRLGVVGHDVASKDAP